ncbi:carbohydrate-binding protein [Paratractidigestivibacter sp.]|uniref:carbohydrate-binding protein n=1 Tax=Paratractidigestivibacter sp. TaxID=2847316 RepID=UPI003A8D6D6D
MALMGVSVGPSVRLATDGGGKPVVETDPPEAPEGFAATYTLVDTGERIEQVWRVEPRSRGEDSLAVAKMAARGLTDADAVRVPLLFGAWYVGVAEYAAGERVERKGRLYRCLQTHQPRLGTEPEATASLWERIEG